MPDGLSNNKKGISSEANLSNRLASMGYPNQKRYMLQPEQGKAIHGTRNSASVFIQPCAMFPDGLAIDLCSQNDTGTAYQKIPFKVLCVAGWKVPGAVIINGDGGSIGKMRDWAKEFGKRYRNVAFVGRTDEFLKYLADLEDPVAAVKVAIAA